MDLIMDAEEIIRVENIGYKYYDRIPALVDVSLDVKKGEKYAIIGSNGSGKSTLLQIMSGLIHPSEGNVLFKGRQVTKDTLRDMGFLKFFREKMGYIFQDSDVQLFCPTVLDELLYGPLQLGLSENEGLDRAFEIMKMLNIENIKDRPSYMLSGGEKKKVAIGSVLTMNPEVLLLDEPTTGLDPRTQCFLMELFFALNEAGKTIVIATHDLSLVDELHSKVAVLSEEHRIEKTGSTKDILHDEDLLLKVNLIHEHMHSHGNITHKHIHSHYLFHKHENKELDMNDIEKLEKLLHHWMEHNEEHAESYRSWAEKMRSIGKNELAEVLEKLSGDTKKLGVYFEKAAKLIK